jgi:drug/metabolite transporter (DMT)-like permease
MLIAGVALALWLRFTGFDPNWRRWWAHYVAAGMINTGIPFVLWAYAALYLTTGELAVLNATSPMWGALMAAAFLGERLSPGRVVGLVLGVGGVALIANPSAGNAILVAAAAGLAAAACYGFIGVYLRRWAPDAPARGLAAGTQLAAGLVLLPLAALSPPPVAVLTPLIVGSVIALGLVCGAVGYVLYFRLIADVGAAGALTVTYLIPLFAMLWGALFLGEPVTLAMAGGTVLVIAGTLLVLRNHP